MPFWLLSVHFFVLRPLFNVDAFIALFVATLNPTVGLVILALSWVLDVVQSMSLAYHFASPLELLRAVRFSEALNWRGFLSAQLITVVAGFGLAAWLATRMLRSWRPNARALLPWLVLVSTLDILNGSAFPSWLGQDSYRIPANVSGSPSYNLVNQALSARASAALPVKRWPDDGSVDPVSWARNSRGNVLVVVVESMGQLQDPELADWLRRQLVNDAPTGPWSAYTDTVEFRGATTAGELRTLCQLSTHYSKLNPVTAAGCMPQRMTDLGYQTFGLHGFTGMMFERNRWWPMLGLQQQTFADGTREDAPQCGSAFRGICDDYMLEQALQILREPNRFVYLLTLNTHMPLTKVKIAPELVTLCRARQVSDSVCQLTWQLGKFLAQTRAGLERLPQAPFVMVVGDHSPPFVVQADRRQFMTTQVPRFILVPR